MTGMRPCGKLPHEYSFCERETERNNLEWKCKGNFCKSTGVQLTEKLNLPIIQPTVIQALPSVLGTLPSLQSMAKRSCPPNSPTKQRKSVPKPKSAVGKILPNLPKIEDLVVPSVVKKVECSSNQLPLLPTIEERVLPSVQLPQTKKRVIVKRVRRVLPSIPSTETRTPPSIPLLETQDSPSIQPTAFKPQTKCKGSRQKRMLPSLPIIEEQTSPMLASQTSNEQNSRSAIKKSEASIERKEDNCKMSPSLQQVRKSTPADGFRQGQKNELQSTKKDIQSLKPRITDVRKKPNKAVKKIQANIQPVEEGTRPSLKLVAKERLHGSDVTAEQVDRVKSPKENRANRLKVKQASNSPQTKEKEELCGLKPLQTSEGTAAQTFSMTKPMRGGRKLNQLSGKEGLSAKRSQNSCLSEAKGVSSNFKRTNKDTVQGTQPAVDKKLPRRSTEKQERASSQNTEEKALLRLRATANLIKNSRESKEKKQFPSLIKKEVPPQSHTIEDRPPVGGAAKNEFYSKINHGGRPSLSSVDRYALLYRMKRESAASSLQSCQHQEKVDKPSSQPVVNRNRASLLSADSYASHSLKRKEFEALSRPQLIANRGQTNSQSSVQEGNTHILTVKPALPSIQPKQESKMPKPPTAPMVMKGLPSARPNVKRAQWKCQMTVSRPLTTIQPIVKQALPSLSSNSSLQKLVKKPLPSVQPEDQFCLPHAAQTTVNPNL